MVAATLWFFAILAALVTNTHGSASFRQLSAAHSEGYNKGFEDGFNLGVPPSSGYRSNNGGPLTPVVEIHMAGVPKMDDPENTQEPEVMNMKNIIELQNFVDDANEGKGEAAVVCRKLKEAKKPLVVKLEDWKDAPTVLKEAKQSYRFLCLGVCIAAGLGLGYLSGAFYNKLKG